MTLKINYPDGSSEIIAQAELVDEKNFHEGMYDFYDDEGRLLRQIWMGSGVKWEIVDESKGKSKE